MRYPAVLVLALLAVSAKAQKTDLPITHISLYKNGIGFFEHTGKVTGDQAVTIAFTTAQLNDVLQSLTAIDLQGGRITGAGYNSTTPLEQQLKSLPFTGNFNTANDFYTAIQGARVEVTGAGPALTGRLLSIEMRSASQNTSDGAPIVQKPYLTVVGDLGAVRTFELTAATTVRLLDTTLHTDINHYLELIDNNRNQSIRRLTLTDQAPDNSHIPRELHISYLAEVPIWKSTYRVLVTPKSTTATLQGWSVIDNTTGSDWTNVHLSLIAGAPQSFIQPLSTPYYGRRPEIPLPEEAQLSPQTHDSGDTNVDSKELMAPAPAGSAGMAGMAAPTKLRSLRAKGVGFSAGIMGGSGQAPPDAPPVPYETSAADSVVPQTTTHAFDDYFAYNLTQPITIRRNESALVPILQTRIDAEPVTLWSPAQPTALRALWITNTSNLTLDRGSFTIVEDGNFGGEGLLEPIHPNERRLLSYAADQAVRVTTDYQHDTRRVQHLSIAKGILKETTAEIAEVEYLVHNAAPETRTVIIEHPIRPGWTLDSDPKPSETTPNEDRFRVITQPNETVRLHIRERRTLNQFYRLTDTTDQQLTLLLQNAKASPGVLQQLEPVFQAKRTLVTLNQQEAAKQQAIDALVKDQDRLRSNLAALKSTPEERSLAKRYTEELSQQEDALAALRKDLATLQQQVATAQRDLSTRIEGLKLDESL